MLPWAWFPIRFVSDTVPIGGSEEPPEPARGRHSEEGLPKPDSRHAEASRTGEKPRTAASRRSRVCEAGSDLEGVGSAPPEGGASPTLALNTPREGRSSAARPPPEGGALPRWPCVRGPKLARARLSLPFSQRPRAMRGRLASGGRVPRDSATVDLVGPLRKAASPSVVTEATTDTGSSGPEGPSERRAAGPAPRGRLCVHDRRPKAATVALRCAPRCVRWRFPAPEGAPATGQTAVSCPRGSNDAAGPKSGARCRSGGLEPKLEDPGTEAPWVQPAEAGRVDAPKRVEFIVPAGAEAPVPRAEARSRPSREALRGVLPAQDPDLLLRMASHATEATSTSSTKRPRLVGVRKTEP